MEPEFPRNGSGCHIVSSAEGGEKVIKCELVRHVDDGHPRAPFVPVAMEEAVITKAEVKKIARCDALRIVVVVLSPWRRYFYEC